MKTTNMYQPLALQMRPQTLDEIVGQQHLIGENKYISTMCKSKKFKNLIFYGRPGTGKTTLATVIANESNYPVDFFNAVQGSKKDLDKIFEEAKKTGTRFLIIDEIHRLNKDKQDLLLPYLENGMIICIGLTTSNPLFAINPAIRSRCLLFEVKPPTKEDVILVLDRTLKKYLENLDKKPSMEIHGKELFLLFELIAEKTNSDVRSALNVLEALLDYDFSKWSSDLIQHIIPLSSGATLGDEETHYNLLSAFQKSIRGSDVNAALYYLGQLLEIGDLLTIERRLLVTAYEDIGMAAPDVVGRVNAATEAAKKVGLPEASIILAEIVAELALCKKSKASHDAIKRVQYSLSKHIFEQPDYIKLTPVGLSNAEKYNYDKPEIWKYIQYLPDEIKDVEFFQPTGREDTYFMENFKLLSSIKRSNDLKMLNQAHKNTTSTPKNNEKTKINWKKTI